MSETLQMRIQTQQYHQKLWGQCWAVWLTCDQQTEQTRQKYVRNYNHIYDVTSLGIGTENSWGENGRKLGPKAAKELRSELCTALWWMYCRTTT